MVSEAKMPDEQDAAALAKENQQLRSRLQELEASARQSAQTIKAFQKVSRC
jgi:hypothetical protein